MVAETLQDVDAEEFPPVRGEYCPRCDATLHDVEPHPDALACPECPYRADLSDFSDIGIVNRVIVQILSACWPETRLVSLVLFGVAAVSIHWTEYIIAPAVAIFGGFAVWQYSPSTYCLACGHSASPSDGFCSNCGETVEDVDAVVDDPEADDLLSRAWSFVDERTPESVTISVPNITVETKRLDWIDRLVVGDRQRWRQFFNGGIVVMVLAQVFVAAFLVFIGWGILFADGGSSASSSGSLPSPTWAWAIPAVMISTGLATCVIVHELGHSVAAAVDGYATEKAGIMLSFGVPFCGWMRNEAEGDEDPRDRLRIVSAGILFNLVTGAAATILLVALGATTEVAWTSPAVLFLQSFAALSLLSVPSNAVPVGGADGELFVETLWEMFQDWRAPEPPSVPDATLGRWHRIAEGYDV